MHALLLTLFVVGANGGPGTIEEGPAPKGVGAVVAGDAGYGGGAGGCNQCGKGGCGHHHNGGGWGNRANMPQTCYDPRYGCYGSSTRLVQRYPAFHGTYYRRPYNYRNVFDYPWHADLHEPTSLFSYNVVNENQAVPGGVGPGGVIPGGRLPGDPPSVIPDKGANLRQPSSVIASPPATGYRR